MAADRELDWDDLRYFLRAARAGTLAGAARAMALDHSTIGRRLSALERTLGAPLMIRAPDGLHPTPLGERLLPLVEAVEAAVLAVQGGATDQAVRVRLAMPSGFTALFSAHLERLRAAQPQLTLELLSGSHTLDLLRGEADLAIRSGPIDGELIARPLGDSGFSLYAAPAYLAKRGAPVDVDDLSGHDVIGFAPALQLLPPAQWIEQHGRGATLVLRGRDMADLQAAALGGAGLALLPCLGADAEPGLVRLTPRVLVRRPLVLAYPRQARLSPPVQAVVGFVMAVMREQAPRVLGTRD
jgi:DNA-binding transcriptional LysR family regulator